MTNRIPDLLIGIGGRRSSGKDLAASYLESKGLLHVSVSDEIRREATAREVDINQRMGLMAVGREVRMSEGGDVFIRRALERFSLEQRMRALGGLAISSHFNIEEAQAILDCGGKIVWLFADDDRRLAREQKRGRPDVPSSIEDLLSREEVEYRGIGGPHAPHLEAVENLPATIHISNDTDDPQDLYRLLDEQLI